MQVKDYRAEHQTVARYWTEAEDHQIQDLDKKGFTDAQIAAKMKRTTAAVKGRLKMIREARRKD